jgi:hypothetical protein
LGILHPDKPGVYLAGVECDGATYHGSPAARDRDRVRQAILENLGWKIVRLWSTDYFIDPENSIDKLDSLLNEILTKDREEIASEPVPVVEVADIIEADEPIIVRSEIDEPELELECTSSSGGFNASDYFKEEHKTRLSNLAKDILKDKPGITLNSLALDIANHHDLSRTSKKQLDHLRSIIEPWAGIAEVEGHKPTVWASPEDVVEEIEWRGVDAFGYPRAWNELAYQEALGLARHALEVAPNNPVDYMCEVFDLKRRHEKTLGIFNDWVSRVR